MPMCEICDESGHPNCPVCSKKPKTFQCESCGLSFPEDEEVTYKGYYTFCRECSDEENELILIN
jgi:hypothetical protein